MSTAGPPGPLASLTESWPQLLRDLEGTERLWCASPALYLARHRMLPRIHGHASGRLLDVGCGAMPFRPHLAGRIRSYEGLDLERRSPDTSLLCDAARMGIVDASCDTVLALSSLEHMPEPWAVLAEMRRVCKPGGKVILCVPHLSRLHEEPHDYWRFTQHSIRFHAARAGFAVVSVEPIGGLFAFLAHQCATVALAMTWRVPVLRWAAFWTSYLLFVRLAICCDDLLGTARKLPMDLLAVLEARS